jgi:hypothetical protein
VDPVTIGLVSMGVGGALKAFGGLFGPDEGALIRKQAQLKLDTLEENMRRTEGQQTQVLSSTKARMAGTGFASDSGSFTDYIQTMSTEFDRQNRATKELGLQSVDLMRQGADMADTNRLLNTVGGLASTGLAFAGLR